jgi:tetratricopeptide (TPR) repeat protein
MRSMSDSVRVVNVDDIAEVPVVENTMRWKPVRRTLGIEAFGINAYVADAGAWVVEEHNEKPDDGDGSGGHQEVYLVTQGHARFTVNGEDVDAPCGTFVFLPDPSARRSAIAVEDGTTVVAVGADPAKLFRPSAWEYSFAAQADVARGDYAGAAATVRQALPQHDDNAHIHYNLACHLARAGEHDDAIAELRRAVELEPDRIRALAGKDQDLDAIRDGDGGLPL